MKRFRILIIIILIFLFERLLNGFFNLPILIFPVFGVFYLVKDSASQKNLGILLAATFIFGFFSGFNPFLYWLIAFITFASLVALKKIVSFETGRWPQATFYSLLFIIEYLLLFASVIPASFLVPRLPLILLESAVLLTVFYYLTPIYEL